MRLDHLLSKETSADETSCCNIPKVRSKALSGVSLFNLEGALGASKRIDVGLAQLGERLPCKQEVSGSIPLISTKRANSSAG